MAALCGWPGFLQLLSGQCSPDRQCTCAKLSLAAGVHFAKLTPTRSFAVLLSAAAVRLISLKSQIPDTVMQTVVCIHAACLISFAIMYKILPSGLNTCRDGGYFMCGSGSPHVCMIISESLSFPCKLELQRWLHATWLHRGCLWQRLPLRADVLCSIHICGNLSEVHTGSSNVQ